MSRVKELQRVTNDSESGYSEDVQYTAEYGSTLLTRPLNQNSMTKRMKLLKTICMLFIYLGMGLWAGIISPTIVDMAELYNCTYEKFISTTSAKSIGVLSGSFVGAFAADKFRPKADLCLFLCNLFGGITILCVPWSPSFILMGFLFFINGLCHGTLNVVCSSVNIAIWGEAAPTPIHALHMFFTLGTTIAPPITIPFLSKDNATQDSIGNITNTTHTGHVRIPYAMFGVYSIFVSIIFLTFFLKGLNYVSTTVKKRESLKEMFNPATIANGNLKYGLYFLGSLFLIYFFLNGRDRPMGMFLFVIAHTDVLHMSKPLSAGLVTAYNLSQAAGRGISALISRWFEPKTMLFTQMLIGILLQMFMVFYALDSVALLFTLSCLYGVISGPTYPTIMGWADRYVEATGMVIAIIDIGIGLGGFVATLSLAHINQKHGSIGVLLFALILSLAILVIIIPLQIVAHIKGDRHKNKPPAHIIQGINVEYDDFREPDNNDTASLLVDN